MSLLACTKRIIEEVERVTNRPVVVKEDADLSVLAHVRIARGDDAMHLLRYKPGGETPPDYYIVYQCGHVLRLYAAPPDKRFDIAVGPEGRQKMAEQMLDSRIPPEARNMGEMLLGGLVTQLRSIPVGFRIEDWILKDYPELADLQKRAALAQLTQGLEAIKIAASGMFPRKVGAASVCMNAAFAAYWGRKWSDPAMTLPYKAAGQLESGMKLLTIYDRTPDDPALDAQLVHDWAFELKLKGWYEAIPFPGTI